VPIYTQIMEPITKDELKNLKANKKLELELAQRNEKIKQLTTTISENVRRVASTRRELDFGERRAQKMRDDLDAGRLESMAKEPLGLTATMKCQLSVINARRNAWIEPKRDITSYLHKTDVSSDIYEEVIKNLHISFPDSPIEHREGGIFIDWN